MRAKNVKWWPYAERNSSFGFALSLCVAREWVPDLDAELTEDGYKPLTRFWMPNMYLQLGPFTAGIGAEISA